MYEELVYDSSSDSDITTTVVSGGLDVTVLFENQKTVTGFVSDGSLLDVVTELMVILDRHYTEEGNDTSVYVRPEEHYPVSVFPGYEFDADGVEWLYSTLFTIFVDNFLKQNGLTRNDVIRSNQSADGIGLWEHREVTGFETDFLEGRFHEKPVPVGAKTKFTFVYWTPKIAQELRSGQREPIRPW